ncbi:ATP-dependent DNA helicase PIF1-like [Apium graveolens]|uniref:ATP-dependent DNA helicase PIF1-like n=1 Tax=Apium graveolens TaxID=4045 RepID=UPI003D7A46B0
MPFGGITIGGDFRRILPVIPLGSRGDVVSACITISRLWQQSKVLLLFRNMRLNQSQSSAEAEGFKLFAEWVLKIGNGDSQPCKDSLLVYEEDNIVILPDFFDPETKNYVQNMIQWTYPDFISMYKSPIYLSERAILTPTNHVVGHLNSVIVDTIPGDESTYYSVDRAEDFGGTASELSFAFPPEYLNSINIPGLPPHELKLKQGVAFMLMRNLNQTLGLCNGTMMMITRCLKQCVECEVICGAFVGTKHFIPRMELCPTEMKLPFNLIRKQMPLQIFYSMTINKSQGQSLERVGLYLPNPVFTHGQLYVAFSRVTSPAGLKIFIDSKDGESTNVTKNFVYKEIFYNLPT